MKHIPVEVAMLLLLLLVGCAPMEAPQPTQPRQSSEDRFLGAVATMWDREVSRDPGALTIEGVVDRFPNFRGHLDEGRRFCEIKKMEGNGWPIAHIRDWQKRNGNADIGPWLSIWTLSATLELCSDNPLLDSPTG